MSGSKPSLSRRIWFGLMSPAWPTFRSPSPLPSPCGRGRIVIQYFADPLCLDSFQRWKRSTLSRERAGVRGNTVPPEPQFLLPPGTMKRCKSPAIARDFSRL